MDTDGMNMDQEMDMLEEADNARKAARENPTEMELLRDKLAETASANAKLMRDNGLSLGENNMQVAFNQMRVQIKVLVEMMYDDEESKTLFEIACQEMIQRDLVMAVEEMEAAKMRAMLTEGVDGMGMGGVDLSALREKTAGMNRAGRRQVAKDVSKIITKGNN